MPYYPLPTHKIIINIPDVVIGDTIIKRTATLFNMNYNVTAEHLALQWVVKHYAKNEDNTLGDYLDFIPDWTKETLADNTTMCDVTNGHPIEKDYDTGQVDEENNPIMDYNPAITYTGQYDFFFMMADTMAVNVHPLIINFGNLITNWTKK